MPLYRLRCQDCGIQKRMLTPEEVGAGVKCKFCGKPVTREVRPPSSDFKETVDNGAMHRRLEIYPDVRELLDKRSKDDDRNRRTTIFEEPNE